MVLPIPTEGPLGTILVASFLAPPSFSMFHAEKRVWKIMSRDLRQSRVIHNARGCRNVVVKLLFCHRSESA